MRVLVAGGAGYVGSHAVKRLIELGHEPTIYDNLGRGHRKVIDLLGVDAVVADLQDSELLTRTLRERDIEAVFHFAAFALVGESSSSPLAYYRNNVSLTITLLESMARAGVDKLVFSSTCAVYGEPVQLPISEEAGKFPVSPYGRSKLMAERILADYLRSRPTFSYAALRYFNASGAAMDGSLGEDHRPETHLIPLVLRAAVGHGPPLTVFGQDHPTRDGTPIRDYVHVDDLAEAHVLAMSHLAPGSAFECNLGTGRGFSVKEIIAVAEKASGRKVPVIWGERRIGDPPALYADVKRCRDLLGWSPRYTSPEDIITSAWRWHYKNPRGYAD